MTPKYEPGAIMYPFTLYYNQLISVKKEFHIPIQIGALAASIDDWAYIPPKRWMAVYQDQLKVGL